MSFFDDTVAKCQKYFPALIIKFKNQSTLMKIIGTIMFFNPNFMTQYLTTIGNTVYFPNQDFIIKKPVASSVILLHELVHIHDEKNRNKILYSFLYLIPQIFIILFFPILFIFGWKLALITLIFLAPLPAYFRMVDEKRAYTVQLYIINRFNNLYNYNIDINEQSLFFAKQFKSSTYYFMWPFNSINRYFSNVAIDIKTGKKPAFVESSVYDMIDDIVK